MVHPKQGKLRVLGYAVPVIILGFIQKMVYILDVIFLRSETKKAIPKLNNELFKLSATKLAERIRKKEISSEELVSAYIKRIQEVNPIINAVVEDRFKEALAEAKEVDKYIKTLNAVNVSLTETKPLLGVPVTVKESIGVKGLSLTGGSLIRKGMKAAEDADAVKLLKKAGAIILLVSNIPEYCYAMETSNKIIGITKSPYDTRRVSGGSTGGEGSLLGSAASVIGIGTDQAGSIRIPAAFNCIYGHKPTAGIVSLGGIFPWSDDKRFQHIMVMGPMARYVEDLELVLKVLAGDNAKKINLDEEVNFQNINLFYMEDTENEWAVLKVDEEIKCAIRKAVLYLKDNYGCRIKPSNFPEMGSNLEMNRITAKLDDSPNPFTQAGVKYVIVEFLKFLFRQSRFTFNAFFCYMLCTYGIPDWEYNVVFKQATDFKKKFMKALGNNGVFLFPTFPIGASRHEDYYSTLLGSRFCAIINIFGCPSTNVPIGVDKNGMPLGIQVIAAPYQDNLCLEVAKKLDEYFGGWQPPF